MLNDIISSIPGQIVGALIWLALGIAFTFIGQKIIARFRAKSSYQAYTGDWEIKVFADDNYECEPQSENKATMKGYRDLSVGNYDLINGRIKRTKPDNEKSKRWYIRGCFIGETFLAMFAESSKRGIRSNGVFFLRYRRDSDNYRGICLKYDSDKNKIVTKFASLKKLDDKDES